MRLECVFEEPRGVRAGRGRVYVFGTASAWHTACVIEDTACGALEARMLGALGATAQTWVAAARVDELAGTEHLYACAAVNDAVDASLDRMALLHAVLDAVADAAAAATPSRNVRPLLAGALHVAACESAALRAAGYADELLLAAAAPPPITV